MYETHDDLTLAQANKFIALMAEGVGTDYELNESPSGEPDQYYVLVVDLETIAEYDFANKAEEDCRKVN